jgi:GntR family transcriptional repressor for pyruvate dehydrogenase complex
MLSLDASAFDKVARDPRLSDKVADLMLKAIVAQRLPPGARLPSERELGEQFGVSRTVVREAVKALAAKGLIEARSGSGLRVAAVDGAAVTESFALFLHGSTINYSKVHEIRTGLEVQMAAAAASRRTDDDLELLERACERVEAAISDSRVAAVHDVEFHRAIGSATHNELYVVLRDAVGVALLDVRRANLGTPTADSLTIAHHRAILDAVRAGSEPAAAEAMRLHLEDVARLWNEVSAERIDGAGSRQPTP